MVKNALKDYALDSLRDVKYKSIIFVNGNVNISFEALFESNSGRIVVCLLLIVPIIVSFFFRSICQRSYEFSWCYIISFQFFSEINDNTETLVSFLCRARMLSNIRFYIPVINGYVLTKFPNLDLLSWSAGYVLEVWTFSLESYQCSSTVTYISGW